VLSHLDPSVSSDNWLGRAPSELYNSSSRKAVGGAGGSNAVGAYDACLSAHAAAASSSPTSPIDAVLSCATPLPLGGENVISNRERQGNSPSLINPLQSSASIFSQTLSSAGGVIAQPSPLRAQSNAAYLSSRDPLRSSSSSSSSSSTSSSNLSDATSGGVLPQNLGHNRPPGSTALQLKCYSLTTNSSNGKNPTSSRLMLENSTVVFIPPSPSDCLLCEIGGGKSTSEEEDLKNRIKINNPVDDKNIDECYTRWYALGFAPPPLPLPPPSSSSLMSSLSTITNSSGTISITNSKQTKVVNNKSLRRMASSLSSS
jgi:hypothetical protein